MRKAIQIGVLLFFLCVQSTLVLSKESTLEDNGHLYLSCVEANGRYYNANLSLKFPLDVGYLFSLDSLYEVDITARADEFARNCLGSFGPTNTDPLTSTLEDRVKVESNNTTYDVTFELATFEPPFIFRVKSAEPVNPIHVEITHVAPVSGMCSSGAATCGAYWYRFFYEDGEPAHVGFTTLLDDQYRFGGNPINPTCSWNGLTVESIDISLKESDRYNENEAKFIADLPCGPLDYESKVIVNTVIVRENNTDTDGDGLTQPE